MGVVGNANLFLINPNGIVFGPNASLDVQGSFVATTANAVEFGSCGIFSASAPGSPQLLDVNPSAFLFNQIPPGAITHQSVAGLQVPQGQNLILLGGNVNLDGGVLQAPSGRVELAGLAESGRVGINEESNNLSLIFPDGGVRADISLSNQALVEASGDIQVQGKRVTLTERSRIKTVTQGAANAGNINDSDILAFADDGKGGDITLNTPAFFGENYRPELSNTDPADTFDKNNRVDLNATGAIDGTITTPDTTFIQNSLTELPENQIDTDSLLATSCIARRNQPTWGSFIVTGTGGLPERPGDAQMSSFPTVDVETLPSDSTPSTPNSHRPWQKGDPIVEPQGVYRLPNGQLVLSRECS